MSKPQNVMLVSIALTAATVCTARACSKRLDETQWPETRDETETLRILSEMRPRRDVSTVSLDSVSRPRRLDRDHIPGVILCQRQYCSMDY